MILDISTKKYLHCNDCEHNGDDEVCEDCFIEADRACKNSPWNDHHRESAEEIEELYRADEKKYDAGKLRMDLIPPEALEAIAEILTYGAKKYSANSWQNLPDFKARYTGALLRHLTAWQRGEERDPESGLRHIDHVLCNAVFLSWKERQC